MRNSKIPSCVVANRLRVSAHHNTTTAIVASPQLSEEGDNAVVYLNIVLIDALIRLLTDRTNRKRLHYFMKKRCN